MEREVTQTILRRPEVLAMLGITAPTLHRTIQRGEFPAPIKISERRVGWLKSEVDAWFEAKQARETSPAPPWTPATADDDDDELQF